MTRKEYQRRISAFYKDCQATQSISLTKNKAFTVTYHIRLHKNSRTEKFKGTHHSYDYYFHSNIRMNIQHGRKIECMAKKETIEVHMERYNKQTFDGIHRKDIREFIYLINY